VRTCASGTGGGRRLAVDSVWVPALPFGAWQVPLGAGGARGLVQNQQLHRTERDRESDRLQRRSRLVGGLVEMNLAKEMPVASKPHGRPPLITLTIGWNAGASRVAALGPGIGAPGKFLDPEIRREVSVQAGEQVPGQRDVASSIGKWLSDLSAVATSPSPGRGGECINRFVRTTIRAVSLRGQGRTGAGRRRLPPALSIRQRPGRMFAAHRLGVAQARAGAGKRSSSPLKRRQSSMNSRRSWETRPGDRPCLLARSSVRSSRIMSAMRRRSRSQRV